MTPFFQILQGDTDVTSRAGKGNISLNLTDGTGQNSDTMDYEISDERGIIAAPVTGVDVKIRGGYRERPLRNFGLFTIDEVSLKGWPQTISVNGQSVGAKTAAKQPRSEGHKKKDVPNFGALIEKIAKRNGLTPSIDPKIKAKELDFEGQTEESDTEFLTRLGDRVGFDVTIKDKNLVITRRGYGKSAGGLLLPIIEIQFGVNVLDYSVSRKDKPKYGKVKAKWFDRENVESKEVDTSSSDDGPDFLIRTPFKTEEEALDAVKTKAEDLRRGTATAEFTIDGNEQARAEAQVVVSGIRSSREIVVDPPSAAMMSVTVSISECYDKRNTLARA